MPTSNAHQIYFFRGDHAFLSNFHRVPGGITVDGLTFEHVEGAYQAAKTTDMQARREIAAARTASRAKYLGRTVKLRKDWEDVKTEVMLELLRLKFADTPATVDLRYLLLATEEKELIEGNDWHSGHHDPWGSCNCPEHRNPDMLPYAKCLEEDFANWKFNGTGENRLGLLLETVRAEIVL